MSSRSPFHSSRRSIKYDRVDPKDYLNHRLQLACEDCSHFAREKEYCTLGFETWPHRQAEQYRNFELTGHIAQCRFLEID